MSGFDVRYAALDFNFKAGCSSDLDCAAKPPCPPPAEVTPEINYLAKDYGSFRQLILDRLALIMPDWRGQHPAHTGNALVAGLPLVPHPLHSPPPPAAPATHPPTTPPDPSAP